MKTKLQLQREARERATKIREAAKAVKAAVKVAAKAALLFALLTVPAKAQVLIHATDDSKSCITAAKTLQAAVDSLPHQKQWDWYVVCGGDAAWNTTKLHFGNPGTEVAFTGEDKQNHTFTVIREGALWPDAIELRQFRTVRDIVAHEMGHVMCKCMDEKEADKAGEKLLKAAKQ